MDRLDRIRLLAPQNVPGTQDGQHRPEVAGLSIEDARQCLPHLALSGVGSFVQQCLGRQDGGGGRISRLNGSGVDERPLNGVQASGGCQPFYGLYLMAIGLGGQQDLGRHEPPV